MDSDQDGGGGVNDTGTDVRPVWFIPSQQGKTGNRKVQKFVEKNQKTTKQTCKIDQCNSP